MLANYLPFFIGYDSDIEIDSCDLAFDSLINNCCNSGTVSVSGLKASESGRKIAVNIGEDISEASVYQIVLSHNKYTLTVGADEGVLRPSEDLTFTPCGATEDVTYLANQYLYYIIQDGDISFSGSWQGRSHIEFTLPEVLSLNGPLQSFTVDE